MKNVKNAKLRKICDKLGIKDIVLNFDDYSVDIWSEDEFTDMILSHSDNKFIYEVGAFNQFSLEQWVDEIKRVFDEGLENYESAKEWQKTIKRNDNGDIVLKLR